MTQKQIIKDVLETAKLNNYTAYELANAIYARNGSAFVAASTVRRTIGDLRREGVDIRTKRYGRAQAYFIAKQS